MFITLPTDAIVADPNQPRKAFDPDALRELADSIGQHGLLEPVIVRRVNTQTPGVSEVHMLIAGERRWRAAQIAGVAALPARVMDLTDEEAFVLSVAENVNRADMNPMEEADAFARLMGFGRTLEEVADLFGKTTRFVQLRLDLLGLTDELRGLVAAGTMRPQLAQQVAKCNPANQQAVLFKWMRGDFANDNEALHFAFALRQAEDQAGFFDVEEPTEEERAKRGNARKATLSLLARTERAAQALDDLVALEVETLADAMTTDRQKFTDRVDHMAKQIAKARFNVRQAAQLAEARDVARVNATPTTEATA